MMDWRNDLIKLSSVLIGCMMLLVLGCYLSQDGTSEYARDYETAPQTCGSATGASTGTIGFGKGFCDYLDERQKAINDRRLADATDELAIYTGRLFIATLVLAVLTGALVYLGFRQGRETIRSLDIASRNADALVASERAHLRAQNVQIDPADLFAYDEATHGAAKLVKIKITWVFENHGRTPADIDSIILALWAGSKQNDIPSIPLRHFEQTIPGANKSGVNEYTSDIMLTRQLGNALIRKHAFVRAEMFVFYYDIFKTRQREHFRWRYDNYEGGERFAMIDRDE